MVIYSWNECTSTNAFSICKLYKSNHDLDPSKNMSNMGKQSMLVEDVTQRMFNSPLCNTVPTLPFKVKHMGDKNSADMISGRTSSLASQEWLNSSLL